VGIHFGVTHFAGLAMTGDSFHFCHKVTREWYVGCSLMISMAPAT